MKHRFVPLLTVAILLGSAAAKADDPPLHEPRVLPGVGTVLPAGACVTQSLFDGAKTYGGACARLRVVFGPILAKPGQDDVLIQPVTFEKPMYPGYLVRFKPDLVRVDGKSPPVKDLHLHHGTWLDNASPRKYGYGPWIASGEEKTIAPWPQGFGLKIEPTDVWLFLHMVHNATSQAFPVWVRYDLDFVPAEIAEADQDPVAPGVQPLIRNTKGIWLDVGDCSWSSDCKKDTLNPIFNTTRGFHGAVPGACVFPRENCAFQNTFAGVSAQQGKYIGEKYDDWTIPIDGTLVMMGGHLHYGGLRDEVTLVRDLNLGKKDLDGKPLPPDVQTRLIHISDALYWDHDFKPSTWKPADDFDLSKQVVGGEPTSWDLVMTGVTRDIGWSINVKKGDKLRLEGIYDTTVGSWWEQMGIVMSWIAPDVSLGVDPFAPGVTIHKGLSSRAINPPTAAGYSLPGAEFGTCAPSESTICVRGPASHARVPTSGDHWSCELNGCPNIARAAAEGRPMDNIPAGGFTFGPADFGVIGTAGIPVVKKGAAVTFWNADTADYMWHTVTRCANPCSGTLSASYPFSDGAYDDLVDPVTRVDAEGRTVDDLIAQLGPDSMDFDSGQIGVGTGATNKPDWSMTPTRTGVFTFYCRIHPSMRGAIKVVE
jgi:plastocyanin